MSQNKTVIPGLEPADENYGQGNASSNFYSRNSQAAARGTVIPGMGINTPDASSRLLSSNNTDSTLLFPATAVIFLSMHLIFPGSSAFREFPFVSIVTSDDVDESVTASCTAYSPSPMTATDFPL